MTISFAEDQNSPLQGDILQVGGIDLTWKNSLVGKFLRPKIYSILDSRILMGFYKLTQRRLYDFVGIVHITFREDRRILIGLYRREDSCTLLGFYIWPQWRHYDFDGILQINA